MFFNYVVVGWSLFETNNPIHFLTPLKEDDGWDPSNTKRRCNIFGFVRINF